MPAPILYLAQAYSKYPEKQYVYEHQAFRNACEWMKKLYDLGFEVFSPILHTHAFHMYLGKPHIDYVAHDLAMIAGWCRHDTKYECHPENLHKGSTCPCGWHGGHKPEIEDRMGCNRNYDSGIVLVFAEDTLSLRQLNKGYGNIDEEWFVDESKSRGAKAEFDFAIKNHIRCIRLEEVLAIASSQEHCKETMGQAWYEKVLKECAELG